MRILFVCMGNICRSPTAEGVMQKLVDAAGLSSRITLDSAGTGNWHVGDLADPRTREAARRRGIELTHRARQISTADLDAFDYIVVMDRANFTSVSRLVGNRPAPKLHYLREFDATARSDGDRPAEVPDPYSGGPQGFEDVLDQCERACAGLLAHVQREL